MIRLGYNLLYPIGLLLFLPGQISKLLRRGNYRYKFGQRFGVYDDDVRSRLASHRCTWIHAVSVGEVAIALKLIAKLREIDPDFFCALTTTTTTGFAFASRTRNDRVEVMYNPLDFWPITRRAYAVIRPIRVILVEAEVWPNLAAEAGNRRIPIALINARLSPRSERRFRRFRFLVAPIFRYLDLICVQEPEDIQRWTALGVAPERIRHVGSIKYDPLVAQVSKPAVSRASSLPNVESISAALSKFDIDPNDPILFGGSTHPGEEAILAQIFQSLRATFPTLKLIIAPRHVERVPQIRPELEKFGLNVGLRSKAGDEPQSSPDCLLLDTTGELQNWYGIATVVFVGKSLTAKGGQNPVEPIMAGKPVVFGPHMENFAALAQDLIAHEAAVQVADAAGLETQIKRLLSDPEAGACLVANAQAALAAHAGATSRTAKRVIELKPFLLSDPHGNPAQS